MKSLSKTIAVLTASIALWAISIPANALTLTYDQMVTGATPSSSSSPYLTVTVTNTQGGVTMDINYNNIHSPEFVTQIFFSLRSGASIAGVTDPSTSPDISTLTCNGAAPAGTGPWQLCMQFDPNLHVNSSALPGHVTFTLLGLSEADFVRNSANWYSVAHIQGIANRCSGWVGAGTGSFVQNSESTDASCSSTSVPEPGSLALLGLGLGIIGFGAGRRRTTQQTAA